MDFDSWAHAAAFAGMKPRTQPWQRCWHEGSAQQWGLKVGERGRCQAQVAAVGHCQLAAGMRPESMCTLAGSNTLKAVQVGWEAEWVHAHCGAPWRGLCPRRWRAHRQQGPPSPALMTRQSGRPACSRAAGRQASTSAARPQRGRSCSSPGGSARAEEPRCLGSAVVRVGFGWGEA